MADSKLENIQDVGTIGGLAGTDLITGLKPGAPDDDFKADLDTIKLYVDNEPVLATATVSSQSSLTFIDGVNGVVFDSTYDVYDIIINDLYHDGAGNFSAQLDFTNNGGVSWGTGNYYHAVKVLNEDNSAIPDRFNNNTLSYWELNNYVGNSATFQHNYIHIRLFKPWAAANCIGHFSAGGLDGTSPADLRSKRGSGMATAGSLDGFRLRVGSTQLFSCRATLRGIKTS